MYVVVHVHVYLLYRPSLSLLSCAIYQEGLGTRLIWSLHCGADDSGLDNTLVVSFVGQTT